MSSCQTFHGAHISTWSACVGLRWAIAYQPELQACMNRGGTGETHHQLLMWTFRRRQSFYKVVRTRGGTRACHTKPPQHAVTCLLTQTGAQWSQHKVNLRFQSKVLMNRVKSLQQWREHGKSLQLCFPRGTCSTRFHPDWMMWGTT